MKAPIFLETLAYHNSEKRRASKMQVQRYCFTRKEYFQNLYAVVYNSVCDLYLNDLIDDYSVDFDSESEKVYVSVWNHAGVYDKEFNKIFESILLAKGFMSWSEQLKDIDIDMLMGEDVFFAQGAEYHDGVDYYDFINMLIL